jgi:hypothetical protein
MANRRLLYRLLAIVCFVMQPLNIVPQAVMSGNSTMFGNGTLSGGPTYAGSWSDNVRRTTLAVGELSKDEYGKDRFRTGGAAVLIQDTSNRIFIATARHVFVNPEKNWAPESLKIRGWRDEKKSRYQDFGSTLLLRKNGQPLFTISTEFDVAIIPVTQEILQRLADDNHKVMTIGPRELGVAEDTYDGADVFILGFPGLIGDLYQQRALMRTGMIAWTDSSGPVDHEFLVDARIFPGNSGGPVFSSAAGMTRNASISSSKPIKLLGIVSLTINARPEVAFGLRLPEDATVIGAAGVGVIEPAHELLKLMAQVP